MASRFPTTAAIRAGAPSKEKMIGTYEGIGDDGIGDDGIGGKREKRTLAARAFGNKGKHMNNNKKTKQIGNNGAIKEIKGSKSIF